jgi:hypothetical protein
LFGQLSGRWSISVCVRTALQKEEKKPNSEIEKGHKQHESEPRTRVEVLEPPTIPHKHCGDNREREQDAKHWKISVTVNSEIGECGCHTERGSTKPALQEPNPA